MLKAKIGVGALLGVSLISCPAFADTPDAEPPPVDLSTLFYLSSLYASTPNGETSEFQVRRGYLTAKLRPTDYFGARMTLDAHQNDDGDMAVRLKYLYGQFHFGDLGSIITGTNVEYGLVHIPWLDFEEHVNSYRMQGTMFLERNGLFNSADFGVTFGGLLGDKLGIDYTSTVSDAYPGSFGSFAFGVYNGGGYHAEEANENKTVEGRLSVRPLGPILPHVQLSYFGLYGKGNTEDAPDWIVHAGMASLEHEYFVVTGTFATGEGDQHGEQLSDGESLDFIGVSGFGEVKLPWIDASLIARFDRFDWGKTGGLSPTRRFIWGAAYRFLDENAILLDWDWVVGEDEGRLIEKTTKATLQVKLP